MNGTNLSFRIFGTTCTVDLPPALDGVPPANDAAWRDPWSEDSLRGAELPPSAVFAVSDRRVQPIAEA
jgi:hypothetical protein